MTPTDSTGRTARHAPPAPLTMSVPGFDVVAGTHEVGTALPRHWHDRPTLCYVLGGRFDEFVRGGTLECRTDTLKLTAVGEPHANRFGYSDVRGVRVDIAPERFAEVPALAKLLDGELVVARSGQRAAFRRVIAELESGDDTSPLVVESVLLELLARLARGRGLKVTQRPPAWLLRADEMVHGLFATRLTLSQLAQELSVTPSVLARA